MQASKKSNKKRMAAAIAEQEDRLAGFGKTEEGNEMESGVATGVDADDYAVGLQLDPAMRKALASGYHVNDEEGLREALASFEYNELPWIERLDVVSAKPLDIEDASDDLARELLFYNSALAAVHAARGEFARLGEPYYRPDDFLAQMLKSDDHMRKVQARLVGEQRRMEAVEQRKREKEAKEFAKQAQAERLKEKARERKDQEKEVEQWRKRRRGQGGAVGSEDADRELEDLLERGPGRAQGAGAGAGRGRGGRGRGGAPMAGAKRRRKDDKYGFGGGKRYRKENDSGSFGEGRFSARQNRQLPAGVRGRGRGRGGGRGGGGGRGRGRGRGGGAGGSRPGKYAREASFARRKAGRG